MESTRLSSKGQIVIPKAVRQWFNWETGQELQVVITKDGVLLKSKQTFEPTGLDEVAGILAYSGTAKTVEEMEEAIAQGMKEQYGRS